MGERVKQIVQSSDSFYATHNLHCDKDGIFRDIKNLSSSNLEIFTGLIDDDKYLTVAGYSREDFSINKLSLSQLLEL